MATRPLDNHSRRPIGDKFHWHSTQVPQFRSLLWSSGLIVVWDVSYFYPSRWEERPEMLYKALVGGWNLDDPSWVVAEILIADLEPLTIREVRSLLLFSVFLNEIRT